MMFPAVAAAMVLAGGCQSARLSDILPPPEQSTAPTRPPSSASSGGPVDTRSYPNLNTIPKPQTEQLTPAERNAGAGSVAAARNRSVQGAGGATADEAARLQQLGQTRGDEVLKEIEAE